MIVIISEGIIIPERLIFYCIIHIVGLESHLPFHGNLEYRHEKTDYEKISSQVFEYGFQFGEHIADNVSGLFVLFSGIIDYHQHTKT